MPKWHKKIPTEKFGAVKVKNKVVWYNQKEKLPFRLKKGKSTELGVFLTPHTGERKVHVVAGPDEADMRSAMLGEIVFKDRYGNIYRDIDLKGVGYLQKRRFNPSAERGVMAPEYDEDRNYGIMNLPDAKEAMKASEAMRKEGIRTSIHLAHIKLDEIVDGEGYKISVQEAKEKNMINREVETPVLVVRAFGVKQRVSYLKDIGKKRMRELVEDAMEYVKTEREHKGTPLKRFGLEDYCDWFAETFGENLAKLHNKGWAHGCMVEHNVTLDCRVVDLDNIKGRGSKKFKNREEKIREIRRNYDWGKSVIVENLADRLKEAYSVDRKKEMVKTFEKSYAKNLKNKRILEEVIR